MTQNLEDLERMTVEEWNNILGETIMVLVKSIKIVINWFSKNMMRESIINN